MTPAESTLRLVEGPAAAASHLLFVPTPARYLMVERQGFLAAPIHGLSKLGAVIHKNRDSASRATDRDVELLAVDQLRRELRVDIDNYTVTVAPCAE